MKETGIIMSGDHPKLILDGIKTQTRRVIKLTCKNEWLLDPDIGWSDEYIKDPDNYLVEECPYGQVGDRLWVRETYSLDWWQAASMVVYKADLKQEDIQRGKLYDPIFKEDTKLYWKPSIFMPRWASRILLEITEIRAERVQEISHDDIVAEGLPRDQYSYLNRFMNLWDSLNAKRGYSWDKNPWVWVISFRSVNTSTQD